MCSVKSHSSEEQYCARRFSAWVCVSDHYRASMLIQSPAYRIANTSPSSTWCFVFTIEKWRVIRTLLFPEHTETRIKWRNPTSNRKIFLLLVSTFHLFFSLRLMTDTHYEQPVRKLRHQMTNSKTSLSPSTRLQLIYPASSVRLKLVEVTVQRG